MFRAYDAERERLVAVKLFNLDLPPEKGHQLVAEFERLIAAELTHPALAAPLATGITGVSAFLAQDYVAAESLDLAVREYGSAPPADALRAAAQLAGALDFAAVANISHGALHPRDVLLSSDDTRLTGIGVARALEMVGVTAPVRRPYTPPERIAGAAWDRRADVFSLAAMMHDLLWARRVSGTGVHAAASLTEIEGGDLGRLRATFARALAEDPLQRFETALEFAEALREAFPTVLLTPPAVVDRRSKKGRPARHEDHQTPSHDHGTPNDERRANERRTTDAEPRLPLDVVEPDRLAAPLIAASSFDAAEMFTKEPETPDLDLRTPEPMRFWERPSRFEDVEVTPAHVEAEAAHAGFSAEVTAGAITVHEPELLSVLERSRSAVWPLVLALMLGLAMGFAGGYGIGAQRQVTSAAASSLAGREFTEGAVNEPARAEDVRTKPDSTEKTASAPGSSPTATVAPSSSKTLAAAPDSGSVRRQPDRAPTPSPAASPATRPAPPASRPAALAAEEIGRLLVRSTPAGARVFVDGREAGRTPAALRDLARGPHRVRITHDGYVTSERAVVITRSHPSESIAVALVPERGRAVRGAPATAPVPSSPGGAGPTAGLLQVESRPPGASVYLDGKLVGTTPVSLPVVPAGEHAIRLERDGYNRWSSSVRVVASANNRVTASLER